MFFLKVIGCPDHSQMPPFISGELFGLKVENKNYIKVNYPKNEIYQNDKLDHFFICFWGQGIQWASYFRHQRSTLTSDARCFVNSFWYVKAPDTTILSNIIFIEVVLLSQFLVRIDMYIRRYAEKSSKAFENNLNISSQLHDFFLW